MSRDCSEFNGGGGFMLFGVRVVAEEGSFRKSVSLNNLSQYELAADEEEPNVNHIVHASGYVSDDVVHNSARNRERKRGVPWTEEEHKLFLQGLQKVGKGDWRGISRNFVRTRTPTQVASHAQKYFLRRNNLNRRRRRRSSLFDITTDALPQQQQHHPAEMNNLATLETGNLQVQEEEAPSSASKIIRPKPVLPIPPPSRSLKVKSTINPSFLSLKLSSSPTTSSSDLSRQPSAFKIMSSSFSSSGENSGNVISVA